MDVDGDTLTLAGDFYTLTDATQIFVIDSSNVADAGDQGDIKSGQICSLHLR